MSELVVVPQPSLLKKIDGEAIARFLRLVAGLGPGHRYASKTNVRSP